MSILAPSIADRGVSRYPSTTAVLSQCQRQPTKTNAYGHQL